MKRALIFRLCSIVTFLLFIRNVDAQIVDSVLVGYRADNSPVKAVSVKLQETMYSFELTPNKQFIGVHFRPYKSGKWKDNGQIGMIELSTGKLLWKENVNFFAENARCTDYGFVVTSRRGTKLLHRNTGRMIWEESLYPIYHDPSTDLLFTYNGWNSKVRAIKIYNAAEVWKGHKISPDYGWPIVEQVDDSTRLIVANGVYKMNIHTGEAKEYEAKTGVSDTRRNLADGLVSVATAAVAVATANIMASQFGMGVGFYWVPTYQNVVAEFHSNLLAADSLRYFADRQKVACMNSNLEPVWELELADGLCSKSNLEIIGDSLRMVNYGYAVKNDGKRVKRGLPFFAVFDKHTGDLLTFNQLTEEKKIMHDVAFDQENAYMIFEEGIAYQNPSKSFVDAKPWDAKEKGKLLDIVNDTIYAFQPLSQEFAPISYAGSSSPVLTDKHNIHVFDRNLNTIAEYDGSTLYRPSAKYKEYLCVRGIRESNQTDCWIIHESGKPLLHIDMPVNDVKSNSYSMILLSYNQLVFLNLNDI